MLFLIGVTQAVEPEEAWVGSWGPRMVIPTPVWPDEVDSWDATAFSGQFNQLTSSEIVFVNVSHPARGDYYTSPNPPLVAAVPSLAYAFPSRDVLSETLDEIDAAGKKAIVYQACGAFGEGNTDWMNYITSQGYTYNTDGLREYIVRYYQNKFGDKIDGWWFDGANAILLRSGPNSGQEMVDAIRSENPNAIITFGGAGELNDYCGGHPTPRTIAGAYSYDYNYQMVTRIEAGPWVDVNYLPVANPVDGCLGHIFSHLQDRWTVNGPIEWTDWQAANWTRRAVDAGGMFTWSVPRESGTSMMYDLQFQVLRKINTVIGGAEFLIDSFETGFGDWTDGGVDCSHYTGPYASHGTCAIELTGNTATSLMSTGDLPMSGSSTAAVDLGFYATGMGTGDTFELQISTNGGGDYTTVKAWTYNTEFALNSTFLNDEYNNDLVHLEGYSFNDQTRFRFRCYAASGSVYIDDIRVDAITTNPPPPLPVDPKPVFICDPIIKYWRNYAKEGQAYENWAESPIITGSAVDGNGDTLTYSKVSGPSWLSVASNGYISGTPGSGDVGINEFTVEADDGTGNTTTAQLIITVEASLPPSFTADPINDDALENVAYSSSIADDASDPEGDPMTFSKVSGPAWLSVASNGDLSGTPGAGDVGVNAFTVQVDATGGSDTATLKISVLKAIVKWGKGGGDTEILNAGVNTAGQNQFPAVYNPATLVNPADGTNGYDVDAVGRTNEFSGAFSNTNTTPVFVNNAAGDYMQLVYNGDFAVTPFETMVAWDSSKFLPGGNGLGEMTVEFKERSGNNVPTVSFVVETSAGWYVTDQTDTTDGYKTFTLDAAAATFSGFNKFGVTAGSGQPDLSDIQSVGVFSSTTNTAVGWTGTFLRHINIVASGGSNQGLLGDLTGDGIVNMEDIAELGKLWLNPHDINTLLQIANNWLYGTSP
jgi:hypothetical protein